MRFIELISRARSRLRDVYVSLVDGHKTKTSRHRSMPSCRGRIESLEPRLLLTGSIIQVNAFDTWNAKPRIIESTDPAGIAYHAPSGHLFIADSEINEIAQFNDKNVFETALDGTAVFNETWPGRDREPTGITWNEADSHFYITNDSDRIITRFDATLGSAKGTVKTSKHGLRDPEGITSDPSGLLYIVNGHPPTVGVFDTDFNFIRSFSASAQMNDAEGIAYSVLNEHLYLVSSDDQAIFEYTLNGDFVEEYSIKDLEPSPKTAQGLSFGPCTDAAGLQCLYIADGGVDNKPDGRIYEVRIGETAAPNQAPEFAPDTYSFGPIPANVAVGTIVGSVFATDSDSDSLTFNISAGNGGNKFRINSSGEIEVAVDLDVETNASYDLTVTVSDGRGGRDTASVTVTVEATEEPPSVTFTPIHDVHSRSNKSKNYGDVDHIRVRNSSTTYNSFLKFDAHGLSGPVQSAMLRLFVVDASKDGGSLHTVSNDYAGTTIPWEESGLTRDNAPTIGGTALASAGAVEIGEWVEFDVTAAISGNGIVSFGLKSDSSNSVKYSSSEGDNPPQLVVESTSNAIPTVTSFAPSGGPIGTEVTITGNGFADVDSISFNGTAATIFTVDTDRQIRVEVPLGATSGLIEITNSIGSTTSATSFNITHAPVADDQSVVTDEDSAIVVALTGSDSDDHPLSYSVREAPSHGTLSGTAPSLTYTPQANFHGIDSFQFRVNDGFVDSQDATVSIVVNAANDVPTASDLAITTNLDTPVAIVLSGNDVDGDFLSHSIISDPSNGVLTGIAPDLTYTPNGGFTGTDAFTYQVDDGMSTSALATVTVTVSDAVSVPMTVSFQDGLNGYTGTRDTRIRGDKPTKNYGTRMKLELDGNPDQVSLIRWDTSEIPSGSTVTSASITLNVLKTSKDDFEIYEALRPWEELTATFGVAENGQPWEVPGAAGVADHAADVLASLTAPSTGLVTIDLNAQGVAMVQRWVMSPAGNHGIVIQDLTNETTDDLDVSSRERIGLGPKLTVTYNTLGIPPIPIDPPSNDPPIAIADSYRVKEGTALTVLEDVGVLANDSDPEDDSLSATLVTAPSSGMLTLDADGAFRYTPNENFNGIDTFTYRATDSEGNSSPVAIVSITVTAQNGTPTEEVTISFQDEMFPTPSYRGTRDTKIRSDHPDRILGTSRKLEVDGRPDMATFLMWDVGVIPAGSFVQSASITLEVVNTSSDVFQIYQVLQPWLETEANFNERQVGVAWQTAGAAGATDRGSIVLGTVTAPSLGTVTIDLNDAGRAVVQSWIDNPSVNFGFIFQNYLDANTQDLEFSSREQRDARLRPKLTIDYAGTPAEVDPASGFEIDLVFADDSLTPSQRQAFTQAARRWSEIITGDLPELTNSTQTIDDLLIEVSSSNIDGAGGVLAHASPTYVREGTFLPARGVVRMDRADTDSVEALGRLLDLVTHEIGHVLGIGTIWRSLGLLAGRGSSNPRFIGRAATAEYNALFGLGESSVPVANTGGSSTQDSHWRESVFGHELMTGYLSTSANPISRVTIASLQDLGYQVNIDAADAFSPPALPGAINGAAVASSHFAGLLEPPVADEQPTSTPALWTNQANPADVNNDGFVSPLDVLQIINDLNSIGARELSGSKTEPGRFVDVSGDNFVSPLDALLVINTINQLPTAEGEAPIFASHVTTRSRSREMTRARIPSPIYSAAECDIVFAEMGVPRISTREVPRFEPLIDAVWAEGTEFDLRFVE